MTAEHTGAMIALVPAEADARRLAMDGGEPVEELHLTLTYLGDAADWDQAERLELVAKVALAAGGRVPVEGDAFHLAFFNPGGEEPALVYGVGGAEVEWIQRQLDGVARMVFGSKIPDPHRPFAAHVTAAYTDDLDAHRGLVGNLGRITFDRVRLAFGGEVIDIRLEEQVPEAPVEGGEFQFGVGPADDLLGDVQDLGETPEQDVTLDQVLLGQQDSGEPGSGAGQLVDELQSLGELQAQALLADVDMPGLVAAMGVYAPIRWHGPLAPIGTPTGDRRLFPPGRIGQASFPQPLRWQEHGMPGHGKAVVVGSILHAEETTWEGEPAIVGHGVFLNPHIIPEVERAVHLVENGVSGPSVDLDSFTAGVADYRGKEIMVVLEARQRGATLVSIPAFADLRIRLEYPEDDPVAGELMDAMIASAAVPGDHMARVLPVAVEYPQDADEPVDGLTAAATLRDAAWASMPPILATRGGLTFAATKTSGWQSAPIAPRSATFDADDAVKRIQAWAGIGTDDADESKFRSMFLWAKPEALDRNNTPLGSAGYRLPWGDIFDGKPYLVYHAVYAAAALLEGGHGGLPNIPDTDKAQLRNTITKIYARFAEAFDDPNVRASWDTREASSMTVETFARDFDESEHPRDPGGDDGGEFVESAGADEGDEDDDDEDDEGDGGSEADPYNSVERFPDAYVKKYGRVIDEAEVGASDLSVVITDTGSFHVARGEGDRTVPVELTAATARSLSDLIYEVAYDGSGDDDTSLHKPTGTRIGQDGEGGVVIEWPDGSVSTLPEDDMFELQESLTLKASEVRKTARAAKKAEAASMDPVTFEAEGLADFSSFAPVFPSERVFAKRDLKGPTKPVVEADGTYYGHMSLWKGCHMGHSQNGICVKPVHSKKNYEPFYTGTVMTAEGTLVKVGKIMGDGDHAGTRGLTAAQVKKYYENTAKTFGIVRLYKDRWGIQFSGVTVPEVTAELAQNMRRSEISPHWHPIDGHLEVVAAIAVNRPAFGITASAATEGIAMDNGTIVYVEGGVQTGLVAAATFDQEEPMNQTTGAGGEGEGEDCGCGMTSDAGETRAAKILGYTVLPTHAELQARQARLAAHLGA